MYKLPEDFTGYDAELLHLSDFKSLCYSLQNSGIFKISSIIDYQYPNNYFEAKIQHNYSDISLLQNCFVPVACFCNKVGDDITYLDNPDISSTINMFSSNIDILPKSILEKSVTDYNLSQLGDYERKQVKFWLPSTIGELLFSWYFD